MRLIKAITIIALVLLIARTPLPSDEWGECYCVNYRQVFTECEGICGSEEECKGFVKMGAATCIGTTCHVTYFLLCENLELNQAFVFETPCERDCPQVSEQ